MPTTDHRSCGEANTGTRSRLKIGVPGGKMWQFQEAVSCPAAHRFARCVGLTVYEPAPEVPNSAVRYRGSPAFSGAGGCQTHTVI